MVCKWGTQLQGLGEADSMLSSRKRPFTGNCQWGFGSPHVTLRAPLLRYKWTVSSGEG
ncbi:hypothetical protein TREES_T100020454 [Tupaia chinensis]|uniref:Uncharacterized protein n=1 Tax=Tupaia chinensis TaxID=246437 RepID=L9KVR9_TUPCH|nr:hypothetical protein TREES_T100020454 [Tupaia chinensis]